MKPATCVNIDKTGFKNVDLPLSLSLEHNNVAISRFEHLSRDDAGQIAYVLLPFAVTGHEANLMHSISETTAWNKLGTVATTLRTATLNLCPFFWCVLCSSLMLQCPPY